MIWTFTAVQAVLVTRRAACVFIDDAAEEPAGADWPLDPRRHIDRWPDLFEQAWDCRGA